MRRYKKIQAELHFLVRGITVDFLKPENAVMTTRKTGAKKGSLKGHRKAVGD